MGSGEHSRIAAIRCAAAALAAAVMVFFGPIPNASAQGDRGGAAEVNVGLFVASAYDLDFHGGTFETIFWVWFIYDDPTYDPIAGMEITNARDYEVMESYGLLRDDRRYYKAAKIRAVINQPWDIADFPFDTQRLDIRIESVGLRRSELVYVPDRGDSITGPELHLPGWQVSPIEIETSAFTYNTAFGENENAAFSAYSRIDFMVPLERANPKLFFEVYIGYAIAFLFCATIWLTSVTNMADYRIGMVLGATFAAIGNKTVFESRYPSATSLGLEDRIEIGTFLLIALCVIISVMAERLALAGRTRLARRLHNGILPAALAIYLVCMIAFVLAAQAR